MWCGREPAGGRVAVEAALSGSMSDPWGRDEQVQPPASELSGFLSPPAVAVPLS